MSVLYFIMGVCTGTLAVMIYGAYSIDKARREIMRPGLQADRVALIVLFGLLTFIAWAAAFRSL